MKNSMPQISNLISHTRQADTIGHILIEHGKLSQEQAEHVLRTQKTNKARFGETAMQLGIVTDSDVKRALAYQFEYPYLEPGEGGLSDQLLTAYQPFCNEVESLRDIRTEIMNAWFSTGKKSLAVVSAEPDVHASVFIANLAVLISQIGHRTALVDANLRSPQQHKIFNLQSDDGLSDLLAGRAGFDVISDIKEIPNLSIVPCGTVPPNPDELLSRPSFQQVSHRLSTQFDIVLYDTPAFTAASDGIAVASRADGILLLARRNISRLDYLDELRLRLDRAGILIAGSVMIDF